MKPNYLWGSMNPFTGNALWVVHSSERLLLATRTCREIIPRHGFLVPAALLQFSLVSKYICFRSLRSTSFPNLHVFAPFALLQPRTQLAKTLQFADGEVLADCYFVIMELTSQSEVRDFRRHVIRDDSLTGNHLHSPHSQIY